MVIQFAHNILSLDVSDQLSSLLSEQEEQTREKIPTVEQEWEGRPGSTLSPQSNKL